MLRCDPLGSARCIAVDGLLAFLHTSMTRQHPLRIPIWSHSPSIRWCVTNATCSAAAPPPCLRFFRRFHSKLAMVQGWPHLWRRCRLGAPFIVGSDCLEEFAQVFHPRLHSVIVWLLPKHLAGLKAGTTTPVARVLRHCHLLTSSAAAPAALAIPARRATVLLRPFLSPPDSRVSLERAQQHAMCVDSGGEGLYNKKLDAPHDLGLIVTGPGARHHRDALFRTVMSHTAVFAGHEGTLTPRFLSETCAVQQLAGFAFLVIDAQEAATPPMPLLLAALRLGVLVLFRGTGLGPRFVEDAVARALGPRWVGPCPEPQDARLALHRWRTQADLTFVLHTIDFESATRTFVHAWPRVLLPNMRLLVRRDVFGISWSLAEWAEGVLGRAEEDRRSVDRLCEGGGAGGAGAHARREEEEHKETARQL